MANNTQKPGEKAMQAVCESLGFVRGVVENLDEGDPEISYFTRLR